MRSTLLSSIITLCLSTPLLAFGEPSATSSSHSERSEKITIGNFTFAPNTITVPVGTRLEWVNEDDVPHIVIGTDPDTPIKSSPLDTNDRYITVLTKPGTYKYFCSIHPHMVGTVIVQ